MAGGIEAVKVHLYDEKSKYIRTYDSTAEFARKNGLNKNIFSYDDWLKDGVYEFEDGYIAATYRIGKEGIRKWKAYQESPLVGTPKNIAEGKMAKSGTGAVVLHDLDGDEIARFRSPFQAWKLTGWHRNKFSIPVGESRKTHDGITITVEAYKD